MKAKFLGILLSALIVGLGVWGLVAVGNAAEAKFVQSFDQTRSVCGQSFVTGPGWSVARGLLASQGYTFGTGVPAITPEALMGVDIFVIGPLGQPLSREETCMLETFVNRGGAVVDVRNMFSPSIFGVVQTEFGGSSYGTFINTSNPDVMQIVAGVGTPIGIGAHSTLTTGGGIPFLVDSACVTCPFGLVFPPTTGRAGRAIIIGDEEIFMNSFTSGCPGAPQIGSPNNQSFLSNIFKYLSEAPGLDPGGLEALRRCQRPLDAWDNRCQFATVGPNVDTVGADQLLKTGLYGWAFSIFNHYTGSVLSPKIEVSSSLDLGCFPPGTIVPTY